MVTIEAPRTRQQTQTGQGNSHRSCDACPRCKDAGSPMCSIPHPKFNNLHPLCNACGHCLLRGKHKDDGADLDEHPGFGNNDPGSTPPPSLN